MLNVTLSKVCKVSNNVINCTIGRSTLRSIMYKYVYVELAKYISQPPQL